MQVRMIFSKVHPATGLVVMYGDRLDIPEELAEVWIAAGACEAAGLEAATAPPGLPEGEDPLPVDEPAAIEEAEEPADEDPLPVDEPVPAAPRPQGRRGGR